MLKMEFVVCVFLCAPVLDCSTRPVILSEKTRRDGPSYEAPEPKFRQQVRAFGRKLRIRVYSQLWRLVLCADLVLTDQVSIMLGQVHEASG
jgi:hypothetical protein